MKAENTTKIQFDSLSVNEATPAGAAAAFLARYDPTVPQLADLKTAVSEAVTNCIVHAYPDRVGPDHIIFVTSKQFCGLNQIVLSCSISFFRRWYPPPAFRQFLPRRNGEGVDKQTDDGVG